MKGRVKETGSLPYHLSLQFLQHNPFATKLVVKAMDTMLARQLTRHKSESSFARYSKRALELQAHQKFYEVFGEERIEDSC